ncbi:hypothetical protein [Streptomyces alanosinicus]|uniref:hypothetical protein n=1 Tax=Streptomyces alanosinicus TaxID=68171 RepID=UPI001671D9B5|nr:hypothetical protein [Streptomyces alanosinicus]
MSEKDFVLIDAYSDESVISWTADFSANNFITVCEKHGGFSDASSEAVISVHGRTFRGSGKRAQDWLGNFQASEIEDGCDFIRFDLSKITLTFHAFGDVHLISADPESGDLEEIRELFEASATKEIRERLSEILRSSQAAGRVA